MLMINVVITEVVVKVVMMMRSPPPMSVVEGAEGAAQKMTAPKRKHLQVIVMTQL